MKCSFSSALFPKRNNIKKTNGSESYRFTHL
jgi:hypothetical protein